MSTRIPREKAVFVEAVEIADPEQRRQFLDQACGTDKALREQVEKLLGVSQSAGDFLQECAPALEAAAASLVLPKFSRAGSRRPAHPGDVSSSAGSAPKRPL